MTPFCECEEMTGVLRDMYATRVQCSCRDAYKKSPERNNNDSTMSNLTQEQYKCGHCGHVGRRRTNGFADGWCAKCKPCDEKANLLERLRKLLAKAPRRCKVDPSDNRCPVRV